MVKAETINEPIFKIGQVVWYRPPEKPEHLRGIVTAYNKQYIFVRFDGVNHSRAMAPINLRVREP